MMTIARKPRECCTACEVNETSCLPTATGAFAVGARERAEAGYNSFDIGDCQKNVRVLHGLLVILFVEY